MQVRIDKVELTEMIQLRVGAIGDPVSILVWLTPHEARALGSHLSNAGAEKLKEYSAIVEIR
jgi:hypothetical protein